MTAWASSLRSVSSATGLTLRRSAATAGSVALASEYCAVPAAPSISATAAECSVENFDCKPVEGSTTPVMERTSGLTRSAISLTAAGSMLSRLRIAITASISGCSTTPQA